MWFFIKTCVIFHLACCFISTDGREITTVQRILNFRRDQIIHFPNKIARNDNSFLYAVCKRGDVKNEINCNVTLETPVSAHDSSNYTCEFQVKGKTLAFVDPNLILNVEHFDEDKAILYWMRTMSDHHWNASVKTFQKMAILTMKTCEYKMISHVYSIHGKEEGLRLNPIVFQNSFDLIFSNETLCRSNDTCRISYDANGNQMAGPVPLPLKAQEKYVQPFSQSSPSKGFVVAEVNPNSRMQHLVLISSSGARTDLPMCQCGNPWTTKVTTSTSNGVFGFCASEADDGEPVECAQFDSHGNTLMNVTISFPGRTMGIAPYNLAEGGMLLVTSSIVKESWSDFAVERLYPDGRRGVPVMLDGLQMKCVDLRYFLKMEVLETSDNEICFYFACEYAAVKERILTYVRKCMPKTEIGL